MFEVCCGDPLEKATNPEGSKSSRTVHSIRSERMLGLKSDCTGHKRQETIPERVWLQGEEQKALFLPLSDSGAELRRVKTKQ